MTRKSQQSIWRTFLLLLIVFSAYLFALFSLSPVLSEGQYQIGTEARQTFTGPLYFSKSDATATGSLTLSLPTIHPLYLRILPDNCIHELRINGRKFTPEKNEQCDWKYGSIVRTSDYFHSGENIIAFAIQNFNAEGGLQFRTLYWDPVLLVVHFLFLLILARILRSLLKNHKKNMDVRLWVIAGAGLFLRLAYFLLTSYQVRTYDIEGHLEYIFFVLRHLSLPDPQSGWQFYQPPLYYVLSALFSYPAQLLSADRTTIITLLKIESLILSACTFLVGIWLAKMFFPDQKRLLYRYLFAGTMAVFPGLVFSASRISNDSLLLLLSFLFFAFLYRWWKSDSPRDWAMTMVIIGLGLLTKSNAIPWALCAFACLFIKKYPKRQWFNPLSSGFLILGGISGWFFVYRFLIEQESNLVGNIARNNPGLKISVDSFWNYLVFRPWHILQFPFNSSWNDLYGRRFFWEHFFKSSLTGEWNLGEPVHLATRAMLVIMMILLVLGLLSTLKNFRAQWKETAPFWTSILFSVGAMMALVMQTHIGGFQDFRYAAFLAIPISFFILQSFTTLSQWLREAMIVLYITFLGLSVFFFYVLLSTT